MTTTDTGSGVEKTVPPTMPADPNPGHDHGPHAECTSGCPQGPKNPPDGESPGE
jgi:hypothetical protein